MNPTTEPPVIPKLSALTSDEKRVMIATLDGFDEVSEIHDKNTGQTSLRGRRGASWFDLPDYCGSLDAIAEAVLRLKNEDTAKSIHNRYRAYLIHLMNIVNPGVTLWRDGEFLGTWVNAINVHDATATQLADAMLIALGKAEL